MLLALAVACVHGSSGVAQSIPDVPAELVFAGVPVHFAEPARLHIQQEVRQLYANRRQLEQDIDALRQLTPLWQSYLTDAGFPTDFRYAALPFATVEPTVYWSVQPQQANALGLRMNEVVDERLHPLIAIETVLNSLKRLRETYHENAVQTLLRHLQAKETAEYLNQNKDRPVFLTADSPPLIWKILARKIAVEQLEPVHRPTTVYLLYTYRSHTRQSVATIARQLNLPTERFSPYNQWLKTDMVPAGEEYAVLVRVKPEEFPEVQAMATTTSAKSSASGQDTGFPLLVRLSLREEGLRAPAVYYTINERRGVQAQPCDNAITLAFYGNLTVNAFLMYNDMTEQDIVRPGEIYYLQPKAKRAKIPFHIVRPNQSLRDVSHMYGVRLASVLRFNNVEPTQRVRAGRVLWLRKKRPQNQPPEYQQVPVEEPTPEPDTITVSSVIPAPVSPALPQRDTAKIQPPVQPVQETIDDSLLVMTTPDIPEPMPEPVAVPERPAEKSSKSGKIHVVKAGQTYYAISRLYGVTPKQLYQWNGLSERMPLEVGQELMVAPNRKVATTSAPPVVRQSPKPKPVPEQQLINNYVVEEKNEDGLYHVVKPGQTVYRVALINKVSVADIVRWNNLKNYTIEVGQYLLIRKPK